MRATNTSLNIEIIGINQIGDEPGNSTITSGRVLPWLQDTSRDDIRRLWGAIWRDVFVLDGLNQVSAIYNLTTHDLGRSENRAALKQMLLKAAELVDLDRDGLPDDWETLYFGGLAKGPTEDPDDDSVDNFTEFAFGTDPTSAKSFQSMTVLLNPASSQVPISVSFRRRAGALLRYSVENSSDLLQWTPAGPQVLVMQAPRNLFDGTGTSQVLCFPTAVARREPAEFIRIQTTPALPP